MLVFLQTEIILKTQFEKKLHVELINRDSVCLFFNLVKNSPVFKNPLGWVRKTLKPSVSTESFNRGVLEQALTIWKATNFSIILTDSYV